MKLQADNGDPMAVPLRESPRVVMIEDSLPETALSNPEILARNPKASFARSLGLTISFT